MEPIAAPPQTSNLRAFLAKKKKEVKSENINAEQKARLQNLIEEQNQDQFGRVINEIQTDALMEAVLGETLIKTRVITEIIKTKMDLPLRMVNARLGAEPESLSKYLSLKDNEGKRVIFSIIQTLIKLAGQGDTTKQYIQMLQQQFIKPNSLLSTLINYIEFQEIRPLLLQTKQIIYFTTYFLQVFQFHNHQDNISKFSEFLFTCKNDEAWRNQQFSTKENLSIYTLEHISYNILHHFSIKQQYQKFFCFLEISEVDLINQFNSQGDTCVDIALRKFPVNQVEMLFKVVKMKKDILLSVSSLNNLLENPHLTQDPTCLSKYIKGIMGAVKRGYIQEITLDNEEHDVIEYYQLNTLLMKLDRQRRYPLLKYISLFKDHEIPIIQQLLPRNFRQLSQNYKTHLKISTHKTKCSKQYCYGKFQQDTQKVTSKLEFTTEEVNVYVRELVLQAVRTAREEVILFLLKQLDSVLFFRSYAGPYAELRDHILIPILLKPNMNNLIHYLVERVFQGSKPTLPLELCQRHRELIELLNGNQEEWRSSYWCGKQKYVPLKEISVDMINQLYLSYLSIRNDVDSDIDQKMMSKFKESYIRYPSQAILPVLINRKKRYIYNQLHHCLTKIQIITILLSLSQEQRNQLFQSLDNSNMQSQLEILELLSEPQLLPLLQQSLSHSLPPPPPGKSNNPSQQQSWIKGKQQQQQQKVVEGQSPPQKLLKGKQKPTRNLLIKTILLHHQNQSVMTQVQKCLLVLVGKEHNKRNQNIMVQVFQELLKYPKAEQTITSVFSKDLQKEIIPECFKGLTKENNSVFKHIIRNRQEKYYESYRTITFRDGERFKKDYQDFKELGINFNFSIRKRYILPVIESMHITKFQKETLVRMVEEDLTFLESLLNSDDTYLEEVKPFMYKDLCFARFNSLLSTREVHHNDHFLILMADNRCNYNILKCLQKVFQSMNFSNIPTGCYSVYERQKSIYSRLLHILDESTRNSIFQKVFPQLLSDQFYKVLIDDQIKDAQNGSHCYTKKEWRSLVPKLNQKSIDLIPMEFYERKENDPFGLLESIVGVVSNSKVVTLFGVISSHVPVVEAASESDKQDEEKQQQKQPPQQKPPGQQQEMILLPIIKKILKKVVKHQTDGSNYKRILIMLKDKISKQEYHWICVLCIKDLINWHVELSYPVIMEELPTLQQGWLKDIYQIIRFRGIPALTLTLLFAIQVKVSNTVLIYDKKRYHYSFDGSVSLSLSLQHFKDYVNYAIKAVQADPKLLPYLSSICTDVALNQVADKLHVVLSLVKSNQFGVDIFDGMFLKAQFGYQSKEGKECINMAYQRMRETRKSIQNFYLLKSIYRHKPQVLSDYQVLPINIQQFVMLLEINCEERGLIRYQSKVIANEQFHPSGYRQLLRTLSNMLKRLYPPAMAQTEAFQTILSNLLFVQNFLKLSSPNQDLSGDRYGRRILKIPKKAGNMILDLIESNSKLCKYISPSIKQPPRRLLSSQRVKNFQNYLNLFPGFLDIKSNRDYMVKFGTREIIQKYLVFFKPQDLVVMILYSNSYPLFNSYIAKLNRQSVRNTIITNLYSLVYKGREDYVIQVLDEFKLYDKAIELLKEGSDSSQINIFHIIIIRKLLKLFNKVLQWASDTSTSIKHLFLQSLSFAKENNFYQYKCIPETIIDLSKESGFKTSVRFFNDDQLLYAVSSMPFLSVFGNKLNSLKLIKSIIKTPSFKTPSIKIKKKDLNKSSTIQTKEKYFKNSLDLHQRFLNIIFNLATLSFEDIQYFDTSSLQILQSIKFLVSKQITLAETKYLKYPLLLLLILYCNTQSQATRECLKKEYPSEIETCQILCSVFGRVINYPSQDKLSIVGYLLDKSLVQDQKYLEFIFKNYSKFIVEELTSDMLAQYSDLIFYLLPSFNLQQNVKVKTSVYSKSITKLEECYPVKYGQVMILNWCCFDNLKGTFDQLLQQLKSQHLSSVLQALKFIDQFHSLKSAPRTISYSQNDSLLSKALNHFTSDLTISPEVFKQLSNNLMEIQEKCYYNLSLINIYITLNSAITIFNKECSTINSSFNVVLSSHSSITNKEGEITVNCKTEVIKNTIVYIESEINYDLSSVSDRIVNTLWISLNKPYLELKLSEAVGVITERAITEKIQVLRDLELRIDFESFEIIGNKYHKQRVFFSESVSKSNILSLLSFYGYMIDRVRVNDLFRVNDITAPHSQFPNIIVEFYQLLPIPKQPITLRCISKSELQKLNSQQNQLIISDISQYYNMVVNAIKQIPDQKYNFNYEIQYYVDDDGVNMNTNLYSFYNIIKFYSILNKFQDEILKDIQGISVKLNTPNLIQLLKVLKESPDNALETVLILASNKIFVRIARFITVSIMTALPNIKTCVSGIRFNLRVVPEEEEGGYVILRRPDWKVYRIKVQLNEPVLDIIIEASLTKIKEPMLFQQPPLMAQIIELFKEKDVVDCIFSDTERLTNYYINRNVMDTQLVDLSKAITAQYQKMTNISLDYKSLYRIVHSMSNRHISEIQHILTLFSNNLLPNIKSKIQLQNSSNHLVNHFNILIHKVAYDIQNFNPTGKSSGMLVYQNNNQYMRKVLSLSNKIIEKVTNTYLIQIWKAHFTSSFILKQKYLLGMKDSSVVYIDAKTNSDLENVDYNNVKWVLLISKVIPDESILPKDKIVRVAVCDLLGDVFLIDNLKEYVLENSISILDLIPIYNSQYNVVFTQKDSPLASNEANTVECQFNSDYDAKIKDIKRGEIHPSDQLRGLIEPKVHDFISSLIVPMKVVISFDFKDNALDISHLVNLFQLQLHSIQKSISQYLSDEKQFYLDQISSTVFPEINLREGYLTVKKTEILSKHIKGVHLRIGQSSPKITIDGDELVIEMNCSKENLEKVEHTEILKHLNEKFCKQQSSYVEIPEQISKGNENYLKLLIMYQLQGKSIEVVKRVYPEIKCQVQCVPVGKERVEFKGNNVFIGINQNRIYSFEDIMLAILQLPPSNRHLIEYTDGFIELNREFRVVDSVIIIPLNPQQPISKLQIKEEKISRIQLEIPDNSIYIVVGQSLYWNKTSDKIILSKEVEISQASGFTFCLNLQTKQKVVPDICHSVLSYKSESQNLPLKGVTSKLRLLTRNIVEFTTNSALKGGETIVNPPRPQPPYSCTDTRPTKLKMKSSQDFYLPYTKFTQIYFSDKKRTVNVNSVELALQEDDFKEPIIENIQDTKHLSEQEETAGIQQQLKNQQPLNVIKSEFPYLSEAGKRRVDTIMLCSKEGVEIYAEPATLTIYFQYSLNPKIKVVPKVTVSNLQLNLEWAPTLRGRYDLVINGVSIPHQHQIAVMASQISFSSIKLSLPKQTVANYCEEIEFSVEYKDAYGNIFGKIEEAYDPKAILLVVKANTQKMKYNLKKIDKYGIHTGYFMYDDMSSQEKRELVVQFMFMKKLIQKFSITIHGLPLQKRHQLFNLELQKLNKYRSRQIKIERSKFLEGLLSYINQDLNTVYTIVFAHQQGIDAGGLKRQFYDLIGGVFKNQKYEFFTPILKSKAKYTFHPKLLKNKRRDVYLRCFGKFLANSILNGYFIGVDFSESFVKVLQGIPIAFEDLKQVLEPNQFQRYNCLKEFSDEDFQNSYLTFCIIDNSKNEVQLKENGRNTPVTAATVNSYLDLIAKYTIHKKYQKCYDAFLIGFEEVFPFSAISKFLKPNEFYILTCGLHQINSQIILSTLTFSNQASVSISWFNRYISSASPQILTKFLKFVTGSSSLPYDVSTTKLVVEFHNEGPNPQKLPISHTCWKSIVIPIYKSYEILEKKLNIAFQLASEGFGFG